MNSARWFVIAAVAVCGGVANAIEPDGVDAAGPVGQASATQLSADHREPETHSHDSDAHQHEDRIEKLFSIRSEYDRRAQDQEAILRRAIQRLRDRMPADYPPSAGRASEP